jgi:hypothetical protein
VIHATPYTSGYPTVISQEANTVFGQAGHFMFFVVQAATALILYTGGNTSFNGFPFLASYVAGDAFLPRWLLKRGHRLVFSNAIVVLTVASAALLILRGADVNSLVPLYAIGVFTAFSMAGFGMARYHSRRREPGWRHRLVINFSAGVLTAVVVGIFAVVKFTEGAWIVLVLFAVLVPALIRLNQEYRAEAEVLDTISENQPPPPPHYARRTVFVLVDDFDLATLAALRYARSLRPTTIRAVHFVIDNVRADKLRHKWTRANRGVSLDFIDVSDRRLARAAVELVEREVADPGTHVTVVLPRRSYSALLGRLLHDRTADKLAAAISRIPRSAATIVPYDVESRVRVLQERQAAKVESAAPKEAVEQQVTAEETAVAAKHGTEAKPVAESPLPGAAISISEPARGPRKPQRQAEAGDGRRSAQDGAEPGGSAVSQIGSLAKPGRYAVEGRVRVVEIKPVERNSVLACEISDGTGDLTVMFYGRSHIPGVVCGARLRVSGPVGFKNGHPVMTNPAYELLFPSG